MSEGTEVIETVEVVETPAEAVETVETPAETTMLNADEVKTETVEAAPIEYEPFAMPDGLTLDENLAGVFKPIFAEMKLSQVDAQKLVDLYSTEVVKKQIEGWNTTLEGWDTAAKTDPEIGGTKYDGSLKTAARAFKSFEVPEAAEILAQYGLHRNPAMIKLFARIGAKMTEPTEIVTGGATDTSDVLASMYPSTQKK